VDTLQKILEELNYLLDFTIFTLGKTPVTNRTVLYIAVLIFLIFYLTTKLKKWIVEGLLIKSTIDLGVREAIGTIISYIIILLGIIIIFQSFGIDLSTVTIITGALGIGVGFGLQSITNNFVSGLVILLERPIKVGDRIEVGSIVGDVVKISARATTLMTNDNIAIIVPNSEFISSKVINWSYIDRDVRFNVPVGVSYNSDPELVKKVLLEVADSCPGVLKKPKPDVIFHEFGDSALSFSLRVWTRDYITKPNVLKSELNYLIHDKFRDYKIEIPFPQRDIHIRSGNIELKAAEKNIPVYPEKG